jgi:hypothetical protein
MLYVLNQIVEVCVHDWLDFNETHHMFDELKPCAYIIQTMFCTDR